MSRRAVAGGLLRVPAFPYVGDAEFAVDIAFPFARRPMHPRPRSGRGSRGRARRACDPALVDEDLDSTLAVDRVADGDDLEGLIAEAADGVPSAASGRRGEGRA